MLMAGADVTMLCSVLMARGIDHIRAIEREMRDWMEQHEYESVEQLKGSMSQQQLPRPERLRARPIHAGRRRHENRRLGMNKVECRIFVMSASTLLHIRRNHPSESAQKPDEDFV